MGPGAAWLLALALVAALHLGALLLHDPLTRVANPDRAAAEFDADRLARASAAPVIFLGTSLTACALPFEDEWPAPHKVGAPPVLRLTRNDGVQEDFQPILDAVAHSTARVVLVEAEMLLRDRAQGRERKNARKSWLHQAASRYRQPIVSAFRKWTLGAKSEAGADPGDSPGCPTTKPTLDQVIALRRALRSEAWQPEWARFLAQADERGQKVILVSLGRSASLQRSLDRRYLAEYERELQAAVAARQLEHWVFDATAMPDSYFSDGAHMNPRGREVFTRWLTARLASENAER